MENIIEYIRLREWKVISETNQRKAISILTLSGGDINNAYISITNINIPNISLNESSINFELPSDSQYETGLLLTNSGEVGSVLSYNINFIDSIYIDEDFEGLDLNDSLVTTEYILPAEWSRSSNGRGWIIGTEETSAWPFDMADFYFDIPEWEDGNYAYTDDGQYNICPSCTPSLDCYPINGCTDGSLDYLLMPSFKPKNSKSTSIVLFQWPIQ